MARKKTEEKAQEGAPAWMVTYGDMMGLLLTFFILIVSFSSIQETKYQKAIGSLKGALGVFRSEPTYRQQTKMQSTEAEEMDKMIGEVQEMKTQVFRANLQKDIKVTLTEKGAHIVISDPLLFDLGDDRLKSQAFPVLNIVANLIKDSPNTDVLVEGHTDNWPINNARFPSNWELSAARALSVVKYLSFRKNLDPARFAATGYGEYRPLKSNDTVENRAKNRRVEIFVNIRRKSG